ncbi:hypothetical protein FB451DRAFT_1174835 [Mycena latifolia]|nr:hypothetical protein FB451DRAFT_1174835 [Mycena latifolia]
MQPRIFFPQDLAGECEAGGRKSREEMYSGLDEVNHQTQGSHAHGKLGAKHPCLNGRRKENFWSDAHQFWEWGDMRCLSARISGLGIGSWSHNETIRSPFVPQVNDRASRITVGVTKVRLTVMMVPTIDENLEIAPTTLNGPNTQTTYPGVDAHANGDRTRGASQQFDLPVSMLTCADDKLTHPNPRTSQHKSIRAGASQFCKLKSEPSLDKDTAARDSLLTAGGVRLKINAYSQLTAVEGIYPSKNQVAGDFRHDPSTAELELNSHLGRIIRNPVSKDASLLPVGGSRGRQRVVHSLCVVWAMFTLANLLGQFCFYKSSRRRDLDAGL